MTIWYNDIYSKSRRHWSTSGLQAAKSRPNLSLKHPIQLQSSYRSAFRTIPVIEISIAPHSTRSAVNIVLHSFTPHNFWPKCESCRCGLQCNMIPWLGLFEHKTKVLGTFLRSEALSLVHPMATDCVTQPISRDLKTFNILYCATIFQDQICR